ncbi:MAG: CRISPR-associated endonuclease Cas2 [Prevotella sp.]|uniref:CRISPR-associated endonuclease Cas2 n=1 Tax=Prevotella sp. TaxID=59823 RepID=UPI0025D20B76|nr:CRISPR-associated endonuclease Cas2 [Prevotella sp.]MCI7119192.1 CRISPR-associated endonuclease Cas2 [Prevotella sp.]
MFILITYDVNITSVDGAKRLRNVAKTCLNYGKRVQNSVFECVLTESQYIMLKHNLENVIDTVEDSVRFYRLGTNWKRKVETIGKNMGTDVTEELII